MKKLYILFAAVCVIFSHAFADNLPAFPGAEGHGRYTTGGRGGSVYYVTSLDDDAKNPKNGTLRYGINMANKRTIVFNVSGTIFLKDALNINNGNLTIAGQTAPGDGICIAGEPVHINADNVIIRFLRFRMGDIDPKVEDDALGGRGIQSIIIDHCSCSWSVDECVSFYGDSKLTMQWCIVSESLRHSNHEKGNHGYGGIWGGPSASFHHILMAHHSSRTPRLGHFYGEPAIDNVDVRNNVIYNYGMVVGAYGGEGMNANFINCYYKPGPSSKTSGNRRSMIFGPSANTGDDADPNRPKWGQYYVSGNWCSSLSDTYKMPTDPYEKNTTKDNWAYGFANNAEGATAAEKQAMRLTEPLNAGVVTTHTAQVAFEKVLNTAGCSLHRDEIDTRIVNETRNGTATFKGSYSAVGGIIDSQNDLKPKGADASWSAWPELVTRDVQTDTDKDGMPDVWEETHGLNPKFPSDRNNVAANGYTHLENYLNSLVEDIVRQELSDFEYIAGSDHNDYYTSLNTKKSADIEFAVSEESLLKVKSDIPIQKIRIYDITGRPLFERNDCELISEFDLAGFPKGFYVVKTYLSGNQDIIRKIRL